jgi:hypothetical protein
MSSFRSFRTNVWNQIEDMFLNDHFSGTKKGEIREISEYADMLERDYDKKAPKPDETQYIRECLARDCISE